MSKEADKFDSAKKGDATILAGLISSDEELDVEEALANEFRGLYKSRLKEMQSVDEQREAAHRHQLQSLQTYVNELSDQNEILVQTVEELEREANERVALVENKLQRTAASLREFSGRASELERQVEKTGQEKDILQEENKALKDELSVTSQQLTQLDSHTHELEQDADALVNLIGVARATGKWELAGLELKAIPLDAILGAHATASKQVREGEKRLNEHIGELKKQLSARDAMIQRLQIEIKTKEQNVKQLTDKMAHGSEKVGSFTGDSKSYDLHTEECSETMTNKDLMIRKLKADLEHLRKQHQETSRELRDSEMKVARIQGQLGKSQDEILLQRSDIAAKEHNIRSLEHQFTENKLEVARCQQVVRELQTEVTKYRENSFSTPEISQMYEQKARRLEAELQVSDEERRKAGEEIIKLQSQLSESEHSKRGQKEALAQELMSRDLELDSMRDKYNSALKEIHEYDKKINHLKAEHTNSAYELEKSKFYVQELEQDLARCRQQISGTQQEQERLHREVQKLRSVSHDQRDALANEVAERHDVILKQKSELAILDDKHREAIAQLSHRANVIQKMRDEVKELNGQVEGYRQSRAELETKLNLSNKRVSELEEKLRENARSSGELSEDLAKQVEDKDKSLREQRGEVASLQEQTQQLQTKVMHREEALQRLQAQQKDCVDEVSRREKAIHKLELELLNSQENYRRAMDDISRRDQTIEQLEAELETQRKQQKEAMEEKGRLEARIQAYKISTQSEHDVLAEEVAKREEAIHRLKIEKLSLQEQQQKSEDAVREHERSVERLKQQYEDTLQEMQQRNITVADMETKLNEMKSKADEYSDQLEQCEDTIREMNLKLNSLEGERDTNAHVAEMKEEAIQQLALEMEDLQEQHRDIIAKMAKREEMIDKLRSETSYLKDQQRDKEKEISQQLDVIHKLEMNLNQSSRELETFQQRTAEDVSDLATKETVNGHNFVRQCCEY